MLKALNNRLALCGVLFLATIFGMALVSLLSIGDSGEALIGEHVEARLRDQTHARVVCTTDRNTDDINLLFFIQELMVQEYRLLLL